MSPKSSPQSGFIGRCILRKSIPREHQNGVTSPLSSPERRYKYFSSLLSLTLLKPLSQNRKKLGFEALHLCSPIQALRSPDSTIRPIMGKNKESGRSKTRPSSSSLAASLLPPGAQTVGFGGYFGGSRVESASTEEEPSTSPSPGGDGEIVLHLKRLGKKDPITKLKALTALRTIFMEKNGEEIVHMIPQWAFEYKRLLNDYNRDVRRATHQTMASLVISVGRLLAPHLKSLMGPWWFSQFDRVSEISLAARKSFEAAFPAQEKRMDALIHYSKEVFTYLDENLRLTPQAMSDKGIPTDELEDMHYNVISSSLLALATLVDMLMGMKTQSKISDAMPESKVSSRATQATGSCAEHILHSHKYFLEFLKSKNAGVRSSTYSALASFLKHAPEAFKEENMKMFCGPILNSLQEKDSSCHSSMWNMILLFSRRFPECWSQSNTQRNALTRLWQFLRNESYGSQQISYPILLPLLDSLPTEVVVEEHFILNFFQNLWLGRNPYRSQPPNVQVFFNALKECLLWTLNKASRSSCLQDEHIGNFQARLLDEVLVKLLWSDYLPLVTSVDSSDSCKGENCSTRAKSMETACSSYPITYIHNLGECIVEILLEIYLKDSATLSTFCSTFLNDCLEVFQKGQNLSRFSELVERIANFFSLLGEVTAAKTRKWLLDYLARPLVAKSLPLIKSLDCPEAVGFLIVIVDIFGPRIVVLYGSSSYKGQDYGENTEEFWKESSAKCFLQAFEDEFIPWCMSGHSKSSSSKLDLLISLLDKESFSAQWDSIIKHSTKILLYGGVEISESDAELVSMLAMLMDKVRGKTKEKKIPDRLNGQEGCLLEDWRHALLDNAAVVACSATCASKSHARFLHSVIGGSSEGDQLCLLSGEALVQIFEKILDNFVAVLVQSSHNWAKIASSLLLSSACQNVDKKKQLSGDQVVSMAQFSLDVLVGSIFSLLKLNKDLKLLPYLLAATFLMEWDESLTMAVLADGVSQHNMIQSAALLEESLDVEKAVDARLSPGGRVGAYAFCSKIGPHFWKSLDSSTLMILRNILIETIRTAVFDVDVLFLKKIPILCCKWVIDVLEVICWNHNEEQMALDQLLSENECWPMWVSPCFGSGTRSAVLVSERECNLAGHEQQHHQFIAFIGELVTGLGVTKVLGGLFYENTSSCSSEDVDLAPSSAYSRPWLAAEILCSWDWVGGSAAESLLPLFIDYNDNPICTKNSFWRYVVSVLLDGAILYGACSQLTFFNLWTPSDDEVENIQDPYLRALVSLLMTLIAKYSTWKRSDAVWVFEHIVNKLYIGTNINKSCLRILPFVLNIISQPIIERNGKSEKSSESIPFNLSLEDSIRGHVVNWLQTAISLPLLAVDKTENQDLVDWIQVIISCYPLNTSGAVGYCSVTRPGEVSALEISLLVKLFRLQRCGQSVPASSQIMLAKLTAVSVGYCWREFGDDDWDYLLIQLHRWTGSSVLMMEEITEKVEDAVVNSTGNQEDIIEKLDFAVQGFDPLQLNISNIALVVLFFFSEHSGGRQMEEDGVLPSNLEKWNNCKDMIFEDVLRLFFATGAAEAIANSLSEEASYVVASSRHGHCDFWRLVCTCVIDSPQHIRKSAVQSMDLWGLSVGPVSSLYALLFSSTPISSLQLAAYNILSTEPVCAISLCDGKTCALQDQDPLAECSAETSEETIELRNEISLLIEKPFPEILEIDLVAEHRVNFFLGWSLLLSYLRYLPSSSPARERLTQHIQDSVSSMILDCIFQHIPLESGSFSNLKKKGADLPIEVSKAAHSAMLAITSGSLSSAVQSLWPVGTEQMAALAGAIYGSMIHLLPAYVRNWFTNLRDRSLTSAIESFTKTWCSPPLIADEFSQMKEAGLVTDYFTVSVNKTAYEIIATYKKEETGMDLVIRLPGCYPLRPVDVECTRSLGISEVKQRKWLLSMTAFIRNQNGAIAEAVRIWKSNFDKEFQGVEECPICYSIIHTANHSLPRLACKTCKHKFHSACLFKWFSTSNKSTCPLCQMPF